MKRINKKDNPVGMFVGGKMYYIYCYTNNANKKTYVGQTNSPTRRRSEHKYAAFTPTSPEYNFLFHRKLREYGLENFKFEILEEIDTTNTDLVDEKEKYWIEVKQSFVKTEKGYNLTYGGQNGGRRSVDLEIIKEIHKILLETKIPMRELSEKYKLAAATIVNINHGLYFKQDGINYPIRKYKIADDIKQSVAYALTNTNETINKIAELYGVARATVKRIQNGETKVEGYNDYPLRKINSREAKRQQVAYLLINTTKTQQAIATEVGLTQVAVQGINSGKSKPLGYTDFPLRKPVSTIKG